MNSDQINKSINGAIILSKIEALLHSTCGDQFLAGNAVDMIDFLLKSHAIKYAGVKLPGTI